MFTDMVGYTALGQRNEPLSLALVDEQRKLIRPVLSRHNGREVKTMGDAFLVEFSSALEAVRCAYDIQRTAREFNFSMAEDSQIHLRIGVHLGDVVESEGDISGDAVNVASRIEPLAEDGGVCITRQVFDQVKGKIGVQLATLGEKQLKNVEGNVEVFRLVMPWEEGPAKSPEVLDARKVAVLPFASISPDPNDSYFADGITEEIISTVSNISGLSVISRTSAMGYKGTTKKIGEIGRELKAGFILEGSFRKSGSKIRVTAQLINANDDSHVWAQSYDRELDDIFAVQSDIAKRVAENLKVNILPSEKERIETPPTTDTAAYALYLKARTLINRFTFADLKSALEYLETAVAKDKTFAAAYAAMAEVHYWLGHFEFLSSDQTFPRAKELASRALELEPDSPEARVVLGMVLVNYDRQYAEAERQYRRALELNPNLADGHLRLASLLLLRGSKSESLQEARKALLLDPLSTIMLHEVGSILLYSRDPDYIDEVVGLLETALRIEPGNPYSQDILGLAYLQKGMLDEGVELLESAQRHTEGYAGDLAYAYVKAGRIADARALLDRMMKNWGTENKHPTAVAGMFSVLGEREKSIEWLEKAFDQHAGYLSWIGSDFLFDNVRSDPRFKALQKRIGFET